MGADAAPALKERTTEPPSWYQSCQMLYNFLTAHGVDRANTWAKDSMAAPCCGFDASDDLVHRQLVCDDATGHFKALYWGPNELKGDIRFGGLSTMANMGTWEHIDFSGNKDLTGEFPAWLLQMQHLNHLNLSGTGLTGPIPKLTSLPALRSLSVANTAVSGVVPETVPATCDLSSTSACILDAAASGKCKVTSKCAVGVFAAPAVPATDGKPGPVGPSYGGSVSTPANTQCNILKSWLIEHGVLATELWSDEGNACCPFWRPKQTDYTKPVTKEVTCTADWGVQHVLFRDAGLKGDINAGAAEMGKLTALRDFSVYGNEELTGSFPIFLTQTPDLFGFSLANTGLTGPIPDLRGLPNLASIDVTGTNFSGPLPPLKRYYQGLTYTAPTYTSCRLSSGSSSSLCWQYDKSDIDPVCLDTNTAVRSCSGGKPVVPVMPTTQPAANGNTDSGSSTTKDTGSSNSVNIGAIIGGVLGGLALLALLAFLAVRMHKRKSTKKAVPAAAAAAAPAAAAPAPVMAEATKTAAPSRLSVDTLATVHSASNNDVVVSPTAQMAEQA